MNDFQAGMRIRFTKTLKGLPTGDHPAFIYACKGDGGRITKIGGCWESYWVKWDGCPDPAFGCEEKHFEKE